MSFCPLLSFIPLEVGLVLQLYLIIKLFVDNGHGRFCRFDDSDDVIVGLWMLKMLCLPISSIPFSLRC